MCELQMQNSVNIISENNITNNDPLKDINEDINKKTSSINLNTSNNIIYNNNSIIDKNFKNDKSSSISLSSKNSSSKKRKKYKLNFLESSSNINNNINNNINENRQMNNNCLICNETLTKEEMENNFVECFHGFCDECYFNYFKEKINNNEIDKIKCPEKNCENIIYNDFIEKKLILDISLLEKYKKLKEKRQLLLDPNIKFCPFANCESYARKEKNKYVMCKNGHKFCFNCLNNWHENKPCIEEDPNFKKWKKSNNVRKCPKCKCFIEKEVGCNHMTCFNCKYQFCWICMKEYHYDHYDSGACRGLQFSTCECLSNKFCRFLYQIIKRIKFFFKCTFLMPIYLYFSIYNKIYSKFDINNKWSDYIFILYLLLLFLSFASSLVTISCFISLLMSIFNPLENKIFDFLDNSEN